MKNTNVFIALRTIAMTQEDSAPVKLKVGYTGKSGYVMKNEVVIIDCPPAIISALQEEGFVFSMCETAGGLLLEDYKMKSKEVEE